MPQPDLPLVDQLVAMGRATIIGGLLVTSALMLVADPWWVVPVATAVAVVVVAPVAWGFFRVSTAERRYDEVVVAEQAAPDDRRAAARRSGLLTGLGLLGFVAALSVVTVLIDGDPFLGGGPIMLASGATTLAHAGRARHWQDSHGRRLFVRRGARRIVFTRKQAMRRLVAMPTAT